MNSIKLRVEYVVDRGEVVSLLGVDEESGGHATIHLDHRPWAAVWRDTARNGPAKAAYAARDVTLQVTFEAGLGTPTGRA
jgi:hypothetical protein